MSAQIAQGAIKKRHRYRQKGSNNRRLNDSDEENVEIREKCKQRKPLRVNVETFDDEAKEIEIDPRVIQKVLVPTEPNYVTPTELIQPEIVESPVQVFVKTTRKLFTPLVTSSFALESRKGKVLSSPKVTVTPSYHTSGKEQPVTDETPQYENITVMHLPPLPTSPSTHKKLTRDISPNIRLMMAKYNQKVQEPPPHSGGSSGSSSPVAWRSPVVERRVKAQTERYQQEIIKHFSPIDKQEVHKSASMSFFVNPEDIASKAGTTHVKSILKSSSTNTLTTQSQASREGTTKDGTLNEFHSKTGLKVIIPEQFNVQFPDARTHKLLKAKEEFLKTPVTPISAPILIAAEEGEIKFPERNRLSQISVGSESSYDSCTCDGILIKSASAGMINVDVETYRLINPEIHGGGYVSLPRSTKKRKDNLITNITSKFRKVKMRRGNKMNVVSALCRQSLVVDINTDGSDETLKADADDGKMESLGVPSREDVRTGSSSGNTSPSTTRSSSWIKKPRLFKQKR